MTFEQYAAEHDAGRNSIGEAGLHMSSARISQKVWMRKVRAQAAKDQAVADRRSALWIEFEGLIVRGEIREPTSLESLESAAAGHPDKASVQAARRVLEKRRARMASA